MVQSEVARQPGGRSKGWGLVDYESPEAATAAIAQLHNSELQGRSIIVRLERAGGANKSGGVNAGRPEASSGLQIVVRNLPWSTTSEDLRQVFQQVGNVVKADAVCHADTGPSPCSSRPVSRHRLRSRASTALSSSTAPCRSSSTATTERGSGRSTQ